MRFPRTPGAAPQPVRAAGLLVGLLFGLLSAGCPGNTVTAGAGFDESYSPLSQGDVCAVEGIYTGCKSHNDGDNWTFALDGYALATGEAVLQVVTDDTACTLQVTEVKAGSACGTPSTISEYEPSAPYTLTMTYSPTPLPFLLNGAGGDQFYANFKASDLSFASDFTINMLFSNDSAKVVTQFQVPYAMVTSTISISGVPAPDDVLSLASLSLAVDAHLVLETLSGSLYLNSGSVSPTSYVVDPTLDDDLVSSGATFGQIDALFNANSPVALGSSPQQIPAAALSPGGSKGFVLGTTKLPQTVDLIVANAENGVTSYKVFEVTFTGP